MSTVIFTSALMFCLTWGWPRQTLDVEKLVGKSEVEVEGYLGKSTGSDAFSLGAGACGCRRHLYLDGLVAIVFTDGKSDRIWVSAKVLLVNERRAKIVALHRFAQYTLIKTKTMGNNICCPSL